jgi:peptide-methionine (S)-S-oxide reductase
MAGIALSSIIGATANAAVKGPVPAPAYDPPVAAPSETAVLSGGCFWATQGVYEYVKGVRHAYAGYTGGSASTAHYKIVSTDSSGHAESVQIVFNPKVISYGQILRIFFSVVDPTELNYQGGDHGTRYRSAIWATSPAQEKIADAYITQLDAAHIYAAPIVVTVAPAEPFYRAEDYHQDYLVNHPSEPYIVQNDLPVVKALQTELAEFYRAKPVLVFPEK